MLATFPAPRDVARWLDGAVVVRLGSTTTSTHFPATPHAMLTVLLPDHAGPVAARMRQSPLAPVAFHTMTTAPTTHRHAGVLRALGVLVRPAAAACLLGASTGVLVDRSMPWSALAGDAEAARLHDAIADATSDAGRVAALFDSLRRTISRVGAQRVPELERLCATVGAQGLGAAGTLGVGARQLERRTRAMLGVPPKQFQRLMRFHRALASAIVDGARPDAARALDAGYYDQSHLARDFRALAGVPPTSLLAGTGDASAWWPLASYRSLAANGSLRDQRGLA